MTNIKAYLAAHSQLETVTGRRWLFYKRLNFTLMHVGKQC